MEFYGGVRGGKINKWSELDFGNDPDHDPALVEPEVPWKRFTSGMSRFKFSLVNIHPDWLVSS